jgi:antitoxin (DNA-binding transcriptional repressor) of toxin-antitoxin stability system
MDPNIKREVPRAWRGSARVLLATSLSEHDPIHVDNPCVGFCLGSPDRMQTANLEGSLERRHGRRCRIKFDKPGLPDPIHLCASCRTRATIPGMAREITQRELRNDSGEIMRALDRGESFVVTRNGVAVGELVPLRRRRLVPAEAAVAAMSGAAPVDGERFRADVDALLNQDPAPRG